MEKAFLSVQDLCNYLNVSESTVYKISHYKVLPKYCPQGRLIYFKKTEVDAWLEKFRLSSADEIKVEVEASFVRTRGGRR